MLATSQTGELFINGKPVGIVIVHGWHGAWGFGDFVPNADFTEFQPMFTRWADLMHESHSMRKLSPELSDGLRDAEFDLYRLHCTIHLPALKQWRQIAIITIDGSMIEWKEAGPAMADTVPELAFAG